MLRELCTADLRSSVPDEPTFPGDSMPFDAEPEWTETAEKRGLNPLGLQGSGIALYQDRLPGINKSPCTFATTVPREH